MPATRRRSRAIVSFLRIAPLLLAAVHAVSAAPEPAPQPRVLDVARDAETGRVWTLSATGDRELMLFSHTATTASSDSFRLDGLDAEARVVAAKVALSADRAVVAFAATGPSRTKYHLALRRGTEWKTLPAFHESRGDAFSVLEVALAGAAGVRVTLLRGAGASYEAWVYDSPDVAAGAGTLTPLRAGAAILAGAASDRPPVPTAVRVRLGRDGLMTIEGGVGEPLGMAELSGDARAQAAAIEELRNRLETAASGPATRDERGLSTLVLEIAADATVRWQFAQWVMQTASDPRIRIHKLRFVQTGRAGSPIDVALPTDVAKPGEVEDRPEEPTIRVALFRIAADDKAAAHTRLRVGEKGEDVELPAETETTAGGTATASPALERLLSGLSRSTPLATGLVLTPLPKGADVPIGDVLRVVRALRAVGIEAIRFGGSALPRRR